MRKKIMVLIAVVLSVYIFLCILLYIVQEKLIFFPERLSKSHRFEFSQPFEELNIKATDGTVLHGLLFKSANSKGLIFYLHGNAGSSASWGGVAPTYTRWGYDVFLLDYRGYGKSDGQIESEKQFFQDVQLAYSEMMKRYSENSIIVLGYSIGTGPATKLASENNPRMLILQAPYFSLTDMVKKTVPFIPSFILKYKLETYRYISSCKMPIVLIHGDEDEVIYYESSVKLRSLLKPGDSLITLLGQGHNGMTSNPEYVKAIEDILSDR
jgi:pimeloyl-ACP methyl ester carboxylesterase